MATKLTFSLRDALKGSLLLQELGFQKEAALTEEFELEISEDSKEELMEELTSQGLEFDMEEIELI